MKIVEDDGSGLPDLGSVVATSTLVNINTLNSISDFEDINTNPVTDFNKISFVFISPPTLTASTQYHLVLSSDASYLTTQADNDKTFDNSLSVGYSYTSLDGIVQYASTVDLSLVKPGNYFRDGTNKLFQIQSVLDNDDQVVLTTGLSINNTVVTDSGSIYQKDSVYISSDISSPTYPDGKASRFDGSFWANDTQGPVPNRFVSNTDFSFNV